MTDAVDWSEVTRLLASLYAASNRLEALFTGRKFTLDGHLVGSVGEVIAAYMFDLRLLRASNRAHDAISLDKRKVEIKLTQGKIVAMRHRPEHLIVLQRQSTSPVRVVFNGPGIIAWKAAGKKQKNGQRPISVAKLATLDAAIDEASRLPMVRTAPV